MSDELYALLLKLTAVLIFNIQYCFMRLSGVITVVAYMPVV